MIAPARRGPVASGSPAYTAGTTDQIPPLTLGQATEDAIVQPGVQCVVQTFGPHRAAGTHRLRLLSLPGARPHLGHREEQFGILIPAGGAVPPVDHFALHHPPPLVAF